MHHLATLAMVAAMLAVPPAKTLVDIVHAPPDRPIVVHADDPIDAMVMWRAVSQFRQAGLELPPLTITVHDDQAACGGNRGQITTTDGYEIRVCARHANPRVEMRWRLRTALHELGHAYTAMAFVEDDVNTFIQINDLKTWLNRKATWEDRAAEVAAESLVWGLGMAPDVRITASCDELLDNYLYITRTQPEAEAFENCEWAHPESGSARLPRVDVGGGVAARE